MRKVFYPVARVGEIQPGEGRQFSVGDLDDCVLFRAEDGGYYATGSLCPHQNERMDLAHLEGCEVVCRRHHLRFDIRTGDCTNAGGFSLRTLDVRVEGDSVQVGVWED